MEDLTIKSDRWCFTAWKKPTYKEKLVMYMVMQNEYCPSSGLEHWQGYVEFLNIYNAQQVSSILKMKGAHVEVARENRETNYKYCTKNESFANERCEYGDINTHINKEEPLFQI